MQVRKKVLTIEDLGLISNFFFDNALGDGNIVIEICVDDKETLKKVNEDFFYRLNKNGTLPKNEDVSDVKVDIGDIHFKYVVKND